MKIKKGFVKNNWPAMVISLFIVVLAIQTWDFPIIVMAIVFVIVVVTKYMKYDENEQEADDWWNKLTKEEKQKVKERKIE